MMVAISLPIDATASPASRADRALDDSIECLDRGDTIGAGARIRWAATLLLAMLAERADLRRPLRKRIRRPATLTNALHKAQRLDDATAAALFRLIQVCNLASHCQNVCDAELRDGVALLRSLVAE